MAKNAAPTLNLLIKSSSYQLILVKTLHFIIFAACWLNNLPLLMKIALSAMVITSRIYQYKQPQPDFYLRYSDKNQWSAAFNNQPFQPINILSTTVITQWLVILHFEIQQHSLTRLIFRDTLSSNDYRCLMVELKINH
ncbi:MAG: protein YgfX [Methylomonas sp.]